METADDGVNHNEFDDLDEEPEEDIQNENDVQNDLDEKDPLLAEIGGYLGPTQDINNGPIQPVELPPIQQRTAPRQPRPPAPLTSTTSVNINNRPPRPVASTTTQRSGYSSQQIIDMAQLQNSTSAGSSSALQNSI